MPVLKVVGITESKGTFEGNPYDNIVLHCANDIELGKGFGQFTQVVKVKRSLMLQNWNMADLKGLVGKSVEVYYDKYQKVDLIKVKA